MPRTKGYVEATGYKKLKEDKLVWWLRLEGDDNFYGCSFNKPIDPNTGNRVENGTMCRFEYEEGKFGRQINMSTFECKEGDKKQVDKAPAKASNFSKNKGSSARDSYWEEKDKWEKEVKQPLIEYNTSYQMAKDIAIAALNNNILPTPGTKKEDRYNALMQAIGNIRDELFNEMRAARQKIINGEPIGVAEEVAAAEKELDFSDLEESMEEEVSASAKKATDGEDWGADDDVDW